MNNRNRHHTIETCVRCRALATGAARILAAIGAPKADGIVPEWIPPGFHAALDTAVGLVVRCDRCVSSWKSPHGQAPNVALLAALEKHLACEHPEVRP